MQKLRYKEAFTLIEVLASMAVLLILVLLMGQLFTDSTKVYELGTRRAQDNMEARATLDFMARDISQAIADDTVGFRLDSQNRTVFGGWENDSLYFVTLVNEPDTTARRSAKEIRYYVDEMDGHTARYVLKRSVKSGNIKCYDTYKWWQDSDIGEARTLVENIGSFEVWCYSGYGTNVPDYDSSLNTPATYHKTPQWVEILLTLLEEDDAIRAEAIYESQGASAAQEYVNRNAKRHEIRVNIENWNGYAKNR